MAVGELESDKDNMKHLIKSISLAAALTCVCGVASAQSAGTWMVKFGANQIAPDVSSGNLSAPSQANSKVDVDADIEPVGSVTYMYTDHVSVEGYFGLPYKHNIVGAGAMAEVGRIGQVKQVSPTIFAQYRANDPGDKVRPYIGLGLTFAYFYGIEGSGTLTAVTNPGGPPTKLSLDKRAKLALSPQVGMTIKVKERWFIDLAVIKSIVSNKAKLSTGQSVDVKLDPVSIGVSVGYQF